MPKTMIEVHEAGQHEQYPRPRCPLCRRASQHGSTQATVPELRDKETDHERDRDLQGPHLAL